MNESHGTQLSNSQINIHLRDADDLELLLEYGQSQSKRVESELIKRYYARTSGFVKRLALNKGLSQDEIDDACQDAVFAMVRAIQQYQVNHPGGCSFWTFLKRLVSNRFVDSLRRRYRERDLINRYTEVAATRQEKGSTDPTKQSLRKELQSRLRKFLDELESPVGDLIAELLNGSTIQYAASHVGISYDRAKRLWRKHRAILRSGF